MLCYAAASHVVLYCVHPREFCAFTGPEMGGRAPFARAGELMAESPKLLSESEGGSSMLFFFLNRLNNKIIKDMYAKVPIDAPATTPPTMPLFRLADGLPESIEPFPKVTVLAP